MNIQQSQADVRQAYYGGALGPWVSTVLWAAAAAVYTWATPGAAMATQLALTVPVGFLLALAFGVVAPHLFFPAAMIIVGAHYLPFVFHYGQKLFAVLGSLMITGGAVLIFTFSAPGALGGWLNAALMLVFGFFLYRSPASQE